MSNRNKNIKTVLLADDEYHILEMLSEMLEISGYQCLKALDGKEALKIYKERKNEIDLYLLDILMPKMSGVELYTEIIKDKPDIKIIFISGYTEKEEIKKFLKKNKLAYLNKPFQFAELLQKINAF